MKRALARAVATVRTVLSCTLRCWFLLLCWSVPAWPAQAVAAGVRAVDATGVRIDLAQPARRVVTLAPHLTEMMFAIGAGSRLIGVSDYSDYPPAARRLPRVGDAFSANRESLLALRPDLVLVWQSGGGSSAAQTLRRLGIAVFVSEPALLLDVPREMEALGELLGLVTSAEAAAASYRASLARARPAPTTVPRRVFLQVGGPALYTVTDRQFLGQALTYCGARNVFGGLAGKAPVVSLEAVVAARPQVVLQFDADAATEPRQWQALGLPRPVRVSAALLSRPGPRFAAGVAQLCRVLQGG